jgi:hypothetical protein
MPRPATPTGRPRRTAVTRIRMGLVPGLLLVLVLALAVAACGGGGGKGGGVASLGGNDKATSTTSPGGGGDSTQADLAYARCMRQHGIDIPDPKTDANGRTDWGELPPGVGPDDPKFKAAQQACRQYRPNGGQAQRPSPQQQQEMLGFARCMRQHGINIPDPTPDGRVDLRDIDPDDPRFKAAERACPGSRPKY